MVDSDFTKFVHLSPQTFRMKMMAIKSFSLLGHAYFFFSTPHKCFLCSYIPIIMQEAEDSGGTQLFMTDSEFSREVDLDFF